jgi:hypothetical protein
MDAASIAKTLTKSGQGMTLTRSEIAFNPVTGGHTVTMEEEWTVHGITTNYNWKDGGSTASGPGSLILAGDKKAIIYAVNDEWGDEIIPQPGDVLTIMETPWTIIAVQSLNPQGVNLMHTCQVRR